MHDNYQPWIVSSREAFLALLPSDIDQDFVEVVATGEKLRINDLRSPVNALTLERGIRNGVYRRIERAYPRSFLLGSANWRVDGVDPVGATATVTVIAPSGERHLVCSLLVRKPDPQI